MPAHQTTNRRIVRRGSVLLAVGLTVLLALPADAQEVPEPTPSQSPSPSASASPSPAPSPTGTTIQPSSRVRPDRTPKKLRRHRQRRQRWAGWTAGPLKAKQGCRPFAHTQTYITWGPALAYGEPVTVVYDASHCTKSSGTAVEVSMQGTARVYQGVLVQGSPIDTRPFTVTGLWERPKVAAGWPLDWWSCDVKHARYSWEIGGVYTFAVTARWGVWSLDVTSKGAASRTVRWTYNAC
jgi:hypothetical protein